MNDFPTLQTERLILREIVSDDIPGLLSIHGDPVVMRWFGADPISDPQQAARLVEVFSGWRQLPNPGVRWGLERKSDHAFLGSCGLFNWVRAAQNGSLGYELAQAAWGCGYMLEALNAVLPWGFESMALHRVEARVHPDNQKSRTLLRKLGFVEEGCLREVAYWAGRHQDLLQFGLLRREYLTG